MLKCVEDIGELHTSLLRDNFLECAIYGRLPSQLPSWVGGASRSVLWYKTME